MFTEMNKAVSKYFRVTKFKLDIINYIFRNPTSVHELLIFAISARVWCNVVREIKFSHDDIQFDGWLYITAGD